MLLLNLIFLLVGVYGDPAKSTDVFISPCPFLSQDLAIGPIASPFNGFKLWSQPSTWPNKVVPGVGGTSGANVTVPCGVAILLDLPNVTVSLLRIQGLLRFLDSPKVSKMLIKANYILVEGQLTIGTPTRQFSQKAVIELTPNLLGNRQTLKFTSFAPADSKHPRDLGHKVFAVVGGQVHLHGLPGDQTMPVWARLRKTANKGDSKILVDKNVAAFWPVGSQIVVASTDYSRKQSETFTILKVLAGATNSTVLLDKPLKYMHYGQPRSLDDGFGGFIDQRAEVALLSRNIVITGTKEAPPKQREGGHFMIFMTPTPQFVEGVQFLRMGQQGNLGRYPLHFHINGNTPKSLCRKNTIQESNQRCIVVHACHNMTIESNVAYDTRGHCFILEEGGEMDNTFVENLGILTEPVKVPISSDETDITPATFWMSNPHNNFLRNVAAGSADSGFWIELRFSVRGASLEIPLLKDIIPVLGSLGTYQDNVAHSNDVAGFRTYPHGIRPRVGNKWEAEGIPGTISGLNLYKNGWMGMFVHNTDYLKITSSVFADNYWGIFLHQDNEVSLENSRIVALSGNLGNPVDCDSGDDWASCRPVKGCKMPLPAGTPGRSTSGALWKAPVFGVLIDVDSRFQSDIDSNKPVSVKNSLFSFFDATCWNSAAITLINDGEGEYWNSAHNIQSLKFTRESNPIWTPPRKFSYFPWGETQDGLEASKFYSIWDKDGSVIGSPGYIVVNNSNILPPTPNACKPNYLGNSYYCPGTCYRSIQIRYIEPGFKVGSQNSQNSESKFSYLQVTRVSDKRSFPIYGNFKQTQKSFGDPLNERFFAFTLLAGEKYIVKVIPGQSSPPTFFPSNISVGYLDYVGCGRGMSLLFEPQTNKAWMGSSGNEVFFKQCPGSDTLPATIQYGPLCINSKQWVEVLLGTEAKEKLVLTQTTASTSCGKSVECSLLWSGQGSWQFDSTGEERRPEFFNPLSISSSWKFGVAPLGYYIWDSETVRTQLPRPSSSRLTYYFRKTFSLKNTACITSLKIRVIVSDGIILYLNNREIVRANMPAGRITNATLALSSSNTFPLWKTFTLDLPAKQNSFFLVEGKNFLAVEQHFAGDWQDSTAFDIRISAVSKGDSCSGAFITPEVCDGVDNDNDGKVDEDQSGQRLKSACSTACGKGIATCILGSFRNCTAPPAREEICNGLDDDCDGLADNGDASLNCGKGMVCSQGKCQPVTSVSDALPLWGKNSSGWLYYDKGGDLDGSNPSWRTGSNVQSWKQGVGPLGFDDSKPIRKWNTLGTRLQSFTEDGKSATAYFLKSFILGVEQVKDIYSLMLNLRRVDGGVVYLNGKEIWRSNLPSGKVQYNTFATTGMGDKEWEPGSNCCDLEWLYYPCTNCTHGTASLLKGGINWIAVEVHVAWAWKGILTFDLDLVQNRLKKCSSLPGSPSSCARGVHQMIFPLSTTKWKFLDGSLGNPSSGWMKPTFSDESWKTGQAPLGYGDLSWLVNTTLNVGPNKKNIKTTYYFRKTFQVDDANCYFKINSTILAKDGLVLYFNGVEAYRSNLPVDIDITSETYAEEDGDWDYHSVILSGGWLKVGRNVVAVELHRFQDNNEVIFFDLQLEGYREGVLCSPKPV